ncbi:hypothetical protein FRC09_016079, partial [Ceratobasidium sp. 395]
VLIPKLVHVAKLRYRFRDVGELSEACRALGRLVELRAEQRGAGSADVEVLERPVDAVTRPIDWQPAAT